MKVELNLEWDDEAKRWYCQGIGSDVGMGLSPIQSVINWASEVLELAVSFIDDYSDDQYTEDGLEYKKQILSLTKYGKPEEE